MDRGEAGRLIADGGAEELLVALFKQARDDLEVIYGQVMLFRKACVRGCLAQHVAMHGLPLTTEDERSALWWYEDWRGLPADLAAMVGVIVQFRRY